VIPDVCDKHPTASPYGYGRLVVDLG
jgi:hypothetical protein